MKTLDTPQERLKAFIKKKFKTQVKFAEFMKSKNAQDITKYVTQGGSVYDRNDKVELLKKAGLNYDWYITGEGEMLVSEKSNVSDVKSVNATVATPILNLDIKKMTPQELKELKEFVEANSKKIDQILELADL